MSMPVITPGTGTRCQAITDIIASVALEQTALSHILNAEGEKIQKIVAGAATADELLAVNKSVNSMCRQHYPAGNAAAEQTAVVRRLPVRRVPNHSLTDSNLLSDMLRGCHFGGRVFFGPTRKIQPKKQGLPCPSRTAHLLWWCDKINCSPHARQRSL